MIRLTDVVGDVWVCCPVLCCAVVSDAGSGGQVLLDSITFSIIKDRLEELGQVRGLDVLSRCKFLYWHHRHA
jgi:hypothetical protein